MSIKITIDGVDKLAKKALAIRQRNQELQAEILRLSSLFGVNAVSEIKEKYLSGPRPRKLAPGKSGMLRARTGFKVAQSGKTTKIVFGNPLIYARIHEKGGITRPNVTTKMRKWAWRRFFETEDPKFKWLALTKRNQLTIKIPARPYLSPGIRAIFPSFQEQLRKSMKLAAREGFNA